MNRIQMLEMAINMLNQAKITQQSIEKIVDNNDIELLGFGETKRSISDNQWAKHIYNIVRGGVGIIEINTQHIQALSQIDVFNQPEEDDEEVNDDDE